MKHAPFLLSLLTFSITCAIPSSFLHAEESTPTPAKADSSQAKEESTKEGVPFVQTAPEKTTLTPRRKQLVHSKVTQNKKDQALVALSSSLSKVAEPSKLAAQTQKETQKDGDKTPAKTNSSTLPPYVFVHGDFLYLKTESEGLSYGQQVPSAQNIFGSPFEDLSGQTERVHPGYHSGFFVEIGGFLPRERGSVTLGWMRLHNEEEAHTAAGTGKFILPTLTNINSEPLAQSATARWHLHLNIVDLSYGKLFKPRTFLGLRPSIGLRAAWIEQEFDVNYTNILYNFGRQAPSIDAHLSNHFKALGLRAGLDSSWHIAHGFSILAKGSTSLLVSKIDIAQKENRGTGDINHIHDKVHPLIPVFELSLGAGWKTSFKNGRYSLAFEAGWQELLFLNETQWQRPYNNLEKTDLGLAGYFLGARFAF